MSCGLIEAFLRSAFCPYLHAFGWQHMLPLGGNDHAGEGCRVLLRLLQYKLLFRYVLNAGGMSAHRPFLLALKCSGGKTDWALLRRCCVNLMNTN